MRGYGFSDPRAAYESLVTASQAELLGDEFKCLSTDFRARNSLSQAEYRAYRTKLLDAHPRLRWGLSRSRVEEIVRYDERHALLLARVPVPFVEDPRIRVALVREDFVEVTVDGKVVATATPADFVEAGVLVIDDRSDGRRLWAAADLIRPLRATDVGSVGSIRLAREWRVDDFSVE